MRNIIQNFLSNRVLSRFTIFALDILMILFSCLSIYYVKYGFTGLTQEVRSDGMTLCLLLILFNTITFISFRTFRGILRFSSFSDLLRIIYALVLGYAPCLCCGNHSQQVHSRFLYHQCGLCRYLLPQHILNDLFAYIGERGL